jgi:hypothetical protein
VLFGAAIGLVFATGISIDASSLPSTGSETLVLNPPVNDPFDGKSTIPQWPADGTGLEVKIINTLDDSWSDTFDAVVEDWEYGNPDAVTISVQKANTESDCQPTEGFIKVCSGNYGDTHWRGITQLQLDGSSNISSATIKLNEAYLTSMSKKVRQYTLCHEIGKFLEVDGPMQSIVKGLIFELSINSGHSLGLAHLDEDFSNFDLGSCMEYTNDVSANRRPNLRNYEILLRIYGGVGADRRTR